MATFFQNVPHAPHSCWSLAVLRNTFISQTLLLAVQAPHVPPSDSSSNVARPQHSSTLLFSMSQLSARWPKCCPSGAKCLCIFSLTQLRQLNNGNNGNGSKSGRLVHLLAFSQWLPKEGARLKFKFKFKYKRHKYTNPNSYSNSTLVDNTNNRPQAPIIIIIIYSGNFFINFINSMHSRIRTRSGPQAHNAHKHTHTNTHKYTLLPFGSTTR